MASGGRQGQKGPTAIWITSGVVRIAISKHAGLRPSPWRRATARATTLRRARTAPPATPTSAATTRWSSSSSS
eukprot:11904179-Alexandrium_andersonii.AAC.1